MNLAYFSDVVELGGAELSLVDYFRALPALPISARLITPHEGPLSDAARAVGAECRVVHMPELTAYEHNPNIFKATHDPRARAAYFSEAARSLWRLAALLRRERIDVLHTNALRAHLYGAVAGHLAGCRVVWHVRDIIVKPWQLHLFHGLGHMVDRIVCVSAPARDAMAVSPSLARKAITIHNAIHLPTYRPTDGEVQRVRAELKLEGCFPIISLVGQLTWNKGHLDLIAAMPSILAHAPQARLLIVGESLSGEEGYRATLRDLVHNLNLEQQVIFTGFRRDVGAILGASDVAVTPSWQEPYPRTVMEAYIAGTPVVATNVGGIPELVRDGETGLLVDPHQPDHLGNAILRALEPEVRERLRRKATRVAHEECSVEAELTRIVGLYEEILRLPRGTLSRAKTNRTSAA